MTRPHHPTALQMIPVDQIVVLNPRDRNGRVFEEIVGNIKKIGLKKPVTVTPRDDLEDGKRYVFESLQEVRDMTADWLHRYNHHRPHESLGRIPPVEYRVKLFPNLYF